MIRAIEKIPEHQYKKRKQTTADRYNEIDQYIISDLQEAFERNIPTFQLIGPQYQAIREKSIHTHIQRRIRFDIEDHFHDTSLFSILFSSYYVKLNELQKLYDSLYQLDYRTITKDDGSRSNEIYIHIEYTRDTEVEMWKFIEDWVNQNICNTSRDRAKIKNNT